MTYVVIARKYRPQTFDDVIGQPHITRTLTNAISHSRVAHAYLFAGPRGIGKTTTARILAKALNCESGPAPTPCNTCASCAEITRGASLDVLEIDGASNRGIDEIRNLRENVRFTPSRGRFRIYIIDEVHMLTQEAFNALLKTLEEPPSHVKFIFATTQAHKVPPTILSRCQRFDFRRIAAGEIIESLKRISSIERLDIQDEALALIARHSDGAMRDAQVMLDQLSSFNQGRIAYDDVSKMLGLVEDEILFGLSKAIKDKDASSAIKIIDRIASDGKDITQAVIGLIEHYRNISVAKIGDKLSNSLIDASPEKIKYYQDESGRYSIEEILYIIYTLSNTIDFIRKTNLSRIPFEAAVIKLTKTDSIVSLDSIMERMEKLKNDDSTDRPTTQSLTSQPQNSGDVKKASKESSKSTDVEEILSAWSGIINYIMPKKISVASYLQEGYPINFESGVVTIGFPKEFQFHKEALESQENRCLIEEAIGRVLNLEVRLAFALVQAVDAERPEKLIEPAVEGHVEPIVKAAMDVFGGTITAQGEKTKRSK